MILDYLFRSKPDIVDHVMNKRSTAGEDGVVSIELSSLIALRHGAQSLSLKAGRVLAPGNGSYRSPFRGRGMEFDEVRPYVPGDDARVLDWRVTARTGRPHTKLFREERERAVLVVLDLQQAMFFATQGAFKAVRVAQAAALLGWAALQQGDRVGGLVFSEAGHVELRPKRGKAALLHFLDRVVIHPTWKQRPAIDQQAIAPNGINHALARLRRVAQPGSLICLLSDFSGLNEQGTAHLLQLARHNNILLACINDPLDAELPPPGHYRVGDGEKFLTVMTESKTVRQRYQQDFLLQQATLQQLCNRHGMTLLALSTAQDPLPTLQSILGARS